MGVRHCVASMVQDIPCFQVAAPSGVGLAECSPWAVFLFLVLVGCWLWLVAPYCNTKVGGSARLVALCEPCREPRQ